MYVHLREKPIIIELTWRRLLINAASLTYLLARILQLNRVHKNNRTRPNKLHTSDKNNFFHPDHQRLDHKGLTK